MESAGTKRKSITDYFDTSGKRPKHGRGAQRLHRELSSVVPGLAMIDNFVTVGEEKRVLQFLDAQEWRTDLRRRVIHYGGTYCLLPPRTATAEERKEIEANIIQADPMPDIFAFLIERMVEHGLYSATCTPAYCIVNEYKDNQGISAHVENFKFISPVCGLTLGYGDFIRFHELTVPDDGSVRTGKAAKAERTGKMVDVRMEPRSLLVMAGEAREKWQHEIVRSRKGRSGVNWKRRIPVIDFTAGMGMVDSLLIKGYQRTWLEGSSISVPWICRPNAGTFIVPGGVPPADEPLGFSGTELVSSSFDHVARPWTCGWETIDH